MTLQWGLHQAHLVPLLQAWHSWPGSLYLQRQPPMLSIASPWGLPGATVTIWLMAKQTAEHMDQTLSNSMKLWAMLCRATQDGQVMVESSDKTKSTGEGNGKPLLYSCLENPTKSMKRKNDRILKEELPRSVGAQYTTGDQWRNNFRKTEEVEPKKKKKTPPSCGCDWWWK